MSIAGALTGLGGLTAPSTALAADLPDYAPPPPPIARPGNCYFRSDVGYSWAMDPNATYVGNAADPDVHNATMDDEWFVETGLGCAANARGFRSELMLGYRSNRDFHGGVDIVVGTTSIDPPITTSITTYTAMLNVYYDFSTYGAITPYVGAGIGAAYHKMDDVILHNPQSPNPQFGDENLQLAWSVMAGIGYRLGARTTLDIGYRYIDMGKARSLHADTASAWNPRLEVDDIVEHEFKIGLRYQFADACCAAAMPLK